MYYHVYVSSFWMGTVIAFTWLLLVHVGDNVIAGSYDKKLCWFDMDLSSKPYKVLRFADPVIN